MKLLYFTSLITLIYLASLTNGQATTSCKYTNSKGVQYDFSTMSNSTSYTFTDGSRNTYVWNICAPSGTCFNNNLNKNTTVCMRTFSNRWNILGLLDSQKFIENSNDANGAVLVYSYPTSIKCPNNTVTVPTTNIMLVCAEEATSVISVAVDPAQPCVYDIIMVGIGACPNDDDDKPHGLGGGWILVIVLACLLATYVLGGIFINLGRGRRGVEVIPNHQFWIDLPSLIKDGAHYLFTCGGSTSRSGYEQV
ncbi:hypothetical protein SAMD00019534_050900 [Acytostelium subglobosum LB1]|uniref:hypothetical protein n=1 Tax=Acytostelium subglobosum LB1 TaxID=1410327 RepID=UPI000644FB8D|nr:hypothetical protein SAMD00019534_050900 [Acytostelium subglobosum LB1]GAM21915.1 hypothetical protein SAMD00019534_050900 [Acytostelium subglobosum LB1]|eukprot:XP_012755015.1 hypothetical protein SAMD00019534_050900 [Acytostelium subglobosum LB1]